MAWAEGKERLRVNSTKPGSSRWMGVFKQDSNWYLALGDDAGTTRDVEVTPHTLALLVRHVAQNTEEPLHTLLAQLLGEEEG